MKAYAPLVTSLLVLSLSLPAAADIYYAADYTSGSSTAGIQEALDAACAAADGTQVVFEGSHSITATITLDEDGTPNDCEGIVLSGTGPLDTLTASTGTTAIKVITDNVTLRDFKITHAGHSASNVGIHLEDTSGTASNVSRVHIESVELFGRNDGSDGFGTGIKAVAAINVSLINSHVWGWNTGIECDEDSNSLYQCNAWSIVNSTIRSNSTAGIDIGDVHSTFSVSGSTIENNATGAICRDGQGTYYSNGNHYENVTYDLHRPNPGCGFVSVNDRFGSGTTASFYKQIHGATKDVFIGSYFPGTGGGISNTTTECVRLIDPANWHSKFAGGLLDEDDVCIQGDLHCVEGFLKDVGAGSDFLIAPKENERYLFSSECIVDTPQTVTISVDECNGNGASCTTQMDTVTCTSTGARELTDFSTTFRIDGGDWTEIDFGSPSGTINQLTYKFCWVDK